MLILHQGKSIVVGVSLVQLTEIIGFIDQTTENIQAGFPTACGAGQAAPSLGSSASL